ncbi:MAG: hypothetical protein IJY71_08370 [Clostridia bacterium]|nr:hypothetical protein [Clostridia bacterium]
MYQINDIIFYGGTGICQVDDIRTEPFDGAPSDVLYYVMHTLHEPRQTIFNPVTNDKVFTRHLLTQEEAEEFLAGASSIEGLTAPSSKLLREEYTKTMKTYLPEGWVKVMRTFMEREAAAVRVTDAERAFFEAAKRHLFTEIALAYGEEPKKAEARVWEALTMAR